MSLPIRRLFNMRCPPVDFSAMISELNSEGLTDQQIADYSELGRPWVNHIKHDRYDFKQAQSGLYLTDMYLRVVQKTPPFYRTN